MKGMKVLFLNYEYPPLGGGAANATAYLLAEFAKFPDMEVHLVTSAVGKHLEQTELGHGIFIHRLPIGKNPENFHKQSMGDMLAYSWRSFLFTCRLIRRQETAFDVTLAFFSVPCGFLALLLKVLFGLPYVVALRGSDVPGYNPKYTTLYVFLRPIIRLIWNQSARVVANSDGLRDLARETNMEQVFDVIPNGVDTERFFPAAEKRPRDEYIITPGASRITERKGLKYLVEAVSMLLPRYPQLRLKILGDGNGRVGLENLVKTKALDTAVTFIGRVPREATLGYYQESSIFVLPSLNEGMSNALLEALASGLPVVTTNTGGTKELVREGENGIIIPFRSSEKIAEAIEFFLLHPEQQAAFGQESRRRAVVQGWNRVAGQFRDILLEAYQCKKV